MGLWVGTTMRMRWIRRVVMDVMSDEIMVIDLSTGVQPCLLLRRTEPIHALVLSWFRESSLRISRLTVLKVSRNICSGPKSWPLSLFFSASWLGRQN